MPKLPSKYASELFDVDDGDEPDIPVAEDPPIREDAIQPNERLIHIIRQRGDTATVKAKCLKYLAIYKPLPDDDPGDGDYHQVGHIASQHSVIMVRPESLAFRIAKYLEEHGVAFLRCNNPKELVEKAPRWVKPWIKHLRRANTWIDPLPYRRKYR